MKKKALSYYLDLMKSALDKQDWNKAKRYGEIAIKKLPMLSYSPREEYILYTRFGFSCNRLSKYSQSLNAYYKANLIAIKNKFEPVYSGFVEYRMGCDLLAMNEISHAMAQVEKVEEYFQTYGEDTFPMGKEERFNNLLRLADCNLYNKNLEKARGLIEGELLQYLKNAPSDGGFAGYYRLKGDYLMALKEYDKARQSFMEALNFTEKLNPAVHSTQHMAMLLKFFLSALDLIQGQVDLAIRNLKALLKDAVRLRFYDFICIIEILLIKCYDFKNMPDKSASMEKRIKPFLNKLEIAWFYQAIREIEQIYIQAKDAYQKSRYNTLYAPPSKVLIQTLNQRYEKLPYRIIGNTSSIQESYKLIEKIAPTDMPVLIQGETGTGKELIARAVHQNSLRKNNNWLALNCAAISETLLENELFGHAKGAFTDAQGDKKGYIELASEGTLFLDEITDMPPAMQQKILRVLDEKLVWQLGAEKPVPVNTRFIFASNQNIEDAVRQKRFRLDLFHRINTIVINLPPLRDRKDDIPLLINHFLAKYSTHKTQDTERIAPDALHLLTAYSWPGNVRELENEIKRICVLHPESIRINKTMLSEQIQKYSSDDYILSAGQLGFKELKKSFERRIIEDALKKCNGNLNQSARLLKYDRSDLRKRIRQLKISIPK